MTNPYQSVLDMQDACNASGVLNHGYLFADAVNAELRAFGLYSTMNFRRHPVIVLYASKLADLCGLVQDTKPFGDVYQFAQRLAAIAPNPIVPGSDTHKDALVAYYANLFQ